MNFGRIKLLSGYNEIDDSNVRQMFDEIYPNFLINKGDIEFLFNYYKGKQPILGRVKKVRPEINNKIVENHANEITTFKTGYLLNKPIQYVARKDEVDGKSLEKLNDFLVIVDKEGKDKLLANHQSICGTAYRLILPNGNYKGDGNDSPFVLYDIDPRQGFVVYSSRLGNKPLFAGFVYEKKDANGNNIWVMEGYTEERYYRLSKDGSEFESLPHAMGVIPIIEYPLNEERLGDFEKVIPLLDAINTVESNRVDGVEQFIQSLVVFHNVDIVEKDFEALKEMGAIKIKDNGTGEKKVEANVKFLSQELNQTQTQSLMNHLYQCVLTICGMPNRNGGSSTSDTGSAVIMRDGWSDAEARASDTETIFKSSERKFLNLALRITTTITENDIKLVSSDLEIKFTRRNYENILQKSQVLTNMLGNNKIAPRLAFVVCGLFNDPEAAYDESYKYYKEMKAEEIANIEMNKQINGGGNNENK